MAKSRSAFTLSDAGRVGYSPAERRVFSLLRGEPRDSKAICLLHYGRVREMPFNGRRIVIGALMSLVRKTRANREPFRIAHTARSGPIPMSFWLEPHPARDSRRGASAGVAP